MMPAFQRSAPIAASTFTSDAIVPLLVRLNRGEVVEFSHAPGTDVAFTIRKSEHRFVLRDPLGRALATAATFAEVWRQRPRETERAR